MSESVILPKQIELEDSNKPLPVAEPPKRGRPRGSTNARKPAAKSDTDQALAVLDGMYKMSALALTMLSYYETAEEVIDSAEKIREQNRAALDASPKLAKYLATAGGVSGTGQFLLVNGMLMAGVANTFRRERNVKLVERAASEAEAARAAQFGDV